MVDTHVHQSGTLELISATEKVDQDEWAPEVELALTNMSQPSGEILSIALSMRSTATGIFFNPAGKLAIFRSDPDISNGDADLDANIHKEALAIIDVVAGDWYTDANGSINYLVTPIPYFNTASLFLAFRNTDAVSINSATGDAEILEVNVLFRNDD